MVVKYHMKTGFFFQVFITDLDSRYFYYRLTLHCLTKFWTFGDFAEIMISLFGRIENMLGKGGKCNFQHSLGKIQSPSLILMKYRKYIEM